jgi:hypothetical protein
MRADSWRQCADSRSAERLLCVNAGKKMRAIVDLRVIVESAWRHAMASTARKPVGIPPGLIEGEGNVGQPA